MYPPPRTASATINRRSCTPGDVQYRRRRKVPLPCGLPLIVRTGKETPKAQMTKVVKFSSRLLLRTFGFNQMSRRPSEITAGRLASCDMLSRFPTLLLRAPYGLNQTKATVALSLPPLFTTCWQASSALYEAFGTRVDGASAADTGKGPRSGLTESDTTATGRTTPRTAEEPG